jgi:hypothetical protein
MKISIVVTGLTRSETEALRDLKGRGVCPYLLPEKGWGKLNVEMRTKRDTLQRSADQLRDLLAKFPNGKIQLIASSYKLVGGKLTLVKNEIIASMLLLTHPQNEFYIYE